MIFKKEATQFSGYFVLQNLRRINSQPRAITKKLHTKVFVRASRRVAELWQNQDDRIAETFWDEIENVSARFLLLCDRKIIYTRVQQTNHDQKLILIVRMRWAVSLPFSVRHKLMEELIQYFFFSLFFFK